ncbi:MAG: hypothetical protein RJA99_4679 [Pseudomonadota bacterium]|jgi:hypothetical protein
MLGATLAFGWASPGRAADGAPADAGGLQALADALLNGVRNRIADCAGSLAQVASAAAGAGLLGVERPRLNWNPRLADAALRHADAMARTRLFDHVGADGSTVRERVDATGYRWQLVGENLAAGQLRLEEAVVDWLNSPSHCAALLDARYTEFGLARIDSDSPTDAYGTYWTLVLGRPR